MAYHSTTTGPGPSEKPAEDMMEVMDAVSDKERVGGDPYYVSPQEEKAVLRKIDRFIMPVFCAVVALQFLDKTTLTYTSVMGIMGDTKMKGDNYAWLGTVFSLGYLLGQYPMCWLQQRLPLAKMTSVTIIIWGAIVAATAACNNWSSLMACRFFLGVFESSLSPALILFTAQWYRKKEQGTRTGVWASFVTWGGILGALIAYGLYMGWMKRTLLIAAWRALFIILGALTILLGVLFFFLVPDTPQTAWFLKPEEREIAYRRTAENMQDLFTKDHRWYQVREASRDPAVWLITCIAVTCGVPNGGITAFYSFMVLSIGVKVEEGILLSMLNCWVAVATIVTMVVGSKIGCRTLSAIPAHVISMVGGILVWRLPRTLVRVRLAGFYLTLVYAMGQMVCMSLISTNVAGRTKKTTVAAMFFVMNCVGNLVGPQTFRDKDAPGYAPALITLVVCNILSIILLTALFAYYKRQNKIRDRQNVPPPPEGEDLTDRENLAFRYVL